MANLETLTPFTSENQPKKNGRIKRQASIIKFTKGSKISKTDIIAMTRFIMPLSVEKIKEMLQDEKVPLFMRAFSKAMLSDLQRGEITKILKLFELAYSQAEKEDEREQQKQVVVYLPDNKRMLIEDETIDK